jgi:hypothetical protein
MVKEPGVPTVKVAWSVLLITGAWSTVRVNVCCAGDPIPFVADSCSV